MRMQLVRARGLKRIGNLTEGFVLNDATRTRTGIETLRLSDGERRREDATRTRTGIETFRPSSHNLSISGDATRTRTGIETIDRTGMLKHASGCNSYAHGD